MTSAMLPAHVQIRDHVAFGEAWDRCERAAGPTIRIALVRVIRRRLEYVAKASDRMSVLPIAVGAGNDRTEALMRLAEKLERRAHA